MSNTVELARAAVVLEGDDGSLRATLLRAAEAMEKMGSQMEQKTKEVKSGLDRIKESADKLKDVGKNLSLHVTAPLMAMGGAAFYGAEKVEHGMARIRAGTGATGEKLEQLGGSFKNVMGSVGADAETIGNTIAALSARTGLIGKPLEDLARQELTLARMQQEDVAPLIQHTTRLFGDWGVATGNQAKTLDLLFRVSQRTGVSVSNLAQQMVFFGAPLRLAGFDMERTAIMLGKWEREGVNVQMVLAGLKRGISSFIREGNDPAAFADTIVALSAVKDKSAQAQKALKLFGSRGVADVIGVLREGRLNISELAAAVQHNSDTILKAGEDTKTFGDRLKELRNKVYLAAQPFGENLVKNLENLIPAATAALNVLGKMGEWFASMPTWMQTTVFVFGGLVAALGPVLYTVGSLVKTLVFFRTAHIAAAAASRMLAGAMAGEAAAATGAAAAEGTAAAATTGLSLSFASLGVALGVGGVVILGLTALVWWLGRAKRAQEELNAAMDRASGDVVKKYITKGVTGQAQGATEWANNVQGWQAKVNELRDKAALESNRVIGKSKMHGEIVETRAGAPTEPTAKALAAAEYQLGVAKRIRDRLVEMAQESGDAWQQLHAPGNNPPPSPGLTELDEKAKAQLNALANKVALAQRAAESPNQPGTPGTPRLAITLVPNIDTMGVQRAIISMVGWIDAKLAQTQEGSAAWNDLIKAKMDAEKAFTEAVGKQAEARLAKRTQEMVAGLQLQQMANQATDKIRAFSEPTTEQKILDPFTGQVITMSQFQQELDAIKAAGIAFTDLTQKEQDAIKKIMSGQKRVDQTWTDGLEDMAAKTRQMAESVGESLVRGIIHGSGNLKDTLRTALEDLAVTAIMGPLKKALKIASPSGEGKWVGQMLGLGVAAGVRGSAGELSHAMAALVTPVTSMGTPSIAAGVARAVAAGPDVSPSMAVEGRGGAGGGDSYQQTTYNVNAMDAKTFAKWAEENHATFGAATALAARRYPGIRAALR